MSVDEENQRPIKKAPFTPPLDTGGSRGSGSDRVEFTGLKNLSKQGVQNAKVVFIALVLIIGSITAVSLYRQRVGDEAAFKYLMEAAQRAEDSSHYSQAAAVRENALAIGKRLFKPAKMLADLDLQIVRASGNATKEQLRQNSYPINRSTIIEVGDHAKKPYLQEALTLYSSTDLDRQSEIEEARWELAQVLTMRSLAMDAHKGFLCPGENWITYGSQRQAFDRQIKINALYHTDLGIISSPRANMSREELARTLYVWHRADYHALDSVSFLQAERSLDSVLEAAGSSNPYSLQGRLALAQDAEKVTDFEGALVEYSCCLGLQQSADGRANFIRMKEAIPFGDLDNGQRDYNEALAILLKLKASSAQNTKLQAQNNVRTSFALAVVLTLLHRYQEAEQTMDTLVAQEKDSWQAFAGRGIILAEQGKFDDAIKSLNHALSLPHAHRGEIKPFLANVYISMGRLPEAERLLK